MNVIVCETLTVKRYHLAILPDGEENWQKKSIGAVKSNSANSVRLDQTDEDGETVSLEVVDEKRIPRVCSPIALQKAIEWVDGTYVNVVEEVKRPVGRPRKTKDEPLSDEMLKALLGEKSDESSENHVD